MLPRHVCTTRISMKACEGLCNHRESSCPIRGWVNKKLEEKGRKRVITLRNRKLRTGDG